MFLLQINYFNEERKYLHLYHQSYNHAVKHVFQDPTLNLALHKQLHNLLTIKYIFLTNKPQKSSQTF